MGRIRRAGATAATTVVVLALSACGSLLQGGGGTAPDGTPLPTVGELWSSMREATLATESGHVTGFLSDEHEAMSIDVEGRRDGSNQRVRFDGSEGAATVSRSATGPTSGGTGTSGPWRRVSRRPGRR